MPPLESLTATMVAPSAASSVAAMEPALPKPWIATRAPLMEMLSTLLACRSVNTVPRAVASLRPSDPPIAIGLPVTTPEMV